MKDIEIEIQVRVENVKPLLSFLKKNGKKVLDDHQNDEYYKPIHRDFATTEPIDEWLRIRESGEYSVTYKNWHHGPDGRAHHCDEFETRIDDVESMRKIFKVLDIKPFIKIDKHRQSWMYKDYEVSIDHVIGLGDFVEVEHKGSLEGDPVAATKKVSLEMIEFLRLVGVGRIERNYVGYPFLLLHGTEGYFEEV